MKKNILGLIILALISFAGTSCGGSSSSELPSIEGTWRTIERTVQTNHPETDAIVNRNFRLDSEVNIVERVFKNSQVTTFAIRITDGNEIRRKTESYTLDGDTLIINSTVKSFYSLSQTRLATRRNVTREDLITILSEIGRFDPNLLPSDIKGEFRTMEVRMAGAQ